MASVSNDDDIITGINVTPLVDITLVLLVVLMVTASYVATRSIPMELPKGATGESIPTTLAVSIDRQGALFLAAEPIAEDALRASVHRAYAMDPEVRATIAADGQVPHARVVHVIDLLRLEKVSRFSLNVEPEVVAAGPARKP